MNPNRRTLRYETSDAIMPDVDRLLEGHSTVGSWTLGQICEHLATVTRMLVDAPALPKPDPALRVSDEKKQEVFATGVLPEQMPMPGSLTTPDAVDATEGASRLKQALEYYRRSAGPVMEHRLFGPLTKEEWDQVILIHSAHHLSFALPRTG